MRFSDGHWGTREGVTLAFATEAYEFTAGTDTLSVYATAKRIEDRLDLTYGPVFSIRCSTPMHDVIAVEVAHFTGSAQRPPDFAVDSVEVPGCTVSQDEDGATLVSGALAVRVNRRPWRLDFLAGGRLLTSSGKRALALADTEGRQYLREQLDLRVGTHVYGLGERFGPLVRNGQAVDIWNEDGGTSTHQSYKNVPFFLTDAGYGVFVDNPGHVSFEVASEYVSRTQFSVEGQSLRYYVIHGPTPKDILRKYTALTGRPVRLPAWSYGLWLSTSFSTAYDERTVTEFIDGMAERDLPLSVFHFDCFWMRELRWCDFEWDPRTFPDPPAMLRRLRGKGLRVSVWINPYVSQLSRLFDEAKERGFLLRRPDGDVWQWDKWQPGLAVVDFTHPEAREWYAGKLAALIEMGVDSFKTDFGERIPTDVVHHDGSDPERMHNYYAYLYNKVVFSALEKSLGAGEAVLFARAATAGSQAFPVHWGGDCESTFPAMAQCLRGGLSLGLSGFGYWSHDIGGFSGRPDAAVFKRWIAFGLLSSHSRLHGSRSYRVPWIFDDESVDVLRRFTRLKMSLMPYLGRVAEQAYTEGLPMMRPMVLEFPEDPACAHLDQQYMLGEDLLVAPVFSAGGEVAYYVPEGVWTSFLSGETVQGPRWVQEHHGFDSLPLLVRPGSVVPVGAVHDRPDYDYADGVTLRVHRLAEGAPSTTRILATDGTLSAVFTARSDGGVVTLTAEWTGGRAWEWQALLVGVTAVSRVEGAAAEPRPDGVLLRAHGADVSAVLEPAA
jgi:alpha-D-xyloside xylohydrolase